MPLVTLGPTIHVDQQRYPALADLGVPDDGLITAAGVEIESEEALAFIRQKCRGVIINDDAKPRPKRTAAPHTTQP